MPDFTDGCALGACGVLMFVLAYLAGLGTGWLLWG